MYIKRALLPTILNQIQETSKIIILYGARQVGKTTLIDHLLPDVKYKTLRIDAQELKYRDVLSSNDVEKLKSFTAGYQLLIIDEAQQISNIGSNLKLIHDHIPKLKVLVTGSSSFDLANKLAEPLTGRHYSHTLYPISLGELSEGKSTFEAHNLIEDRLIYGSYPEVITIQSYRERKEYLNNLCSSYLYRDVLQIAQIKNSSKLRDLLKLLAFQIGSEVSLSELGVRLSMSKDTVSRYIDLLEKSFVLFRLTGLSRNLRKEVSKMDKIYFYDLGVRNSIIDMVKPLNERNDVGQLWENYLLVERFKYNSYKQRYSTPYFWRLHTGAEIDYIEEIEGVMHGYEFKWGNKLKKCPASWNETYTSSTFQTINQDNYLPFIRE